MKKTLLMMLLAWAFTTYAQNKYLYTSFNNFTEVEGTAYVIANVKNWSKAEAAKNRYLLFIDTKTGETNQVDFPGEGYFDKIEQVKIDSLGINKIIVATQTVDLNGRKGIDWNDPTQLIILSVDGKERVQLTDNKLFVRTWMVNKKTGTLIVAGHYDTNNNGKKDKEDQNEINIYDLKTLKLIKKI